MTHRISCLMVTNGRMETLQQSILFYLRQTWPEKELIIVNDGTPDIRNAITSHVEALKRPDVRCVLLDTRRTVGALRNCSIESASGDILCQWDDDDYYHPRRLEVQLEHMNAQSADASYMYDVLNYFADTRELYWTDWSFQRTKDIDHGHPGTIMCKRSVDLRYPFAGTKSSLGEDAELQKDLYRQFNVTGLRMAGRAPTISYIELCSFLYTIYMSCALSCLTCTKGTVPMGPAMRLLLPE